MDTMSKEKRSKIMRSIRSKDTGPEMAVRRCLHSKGYRYKLHYSGLPGKPDLVFPSRHKVIFIHGCFWHQHRECKNGGMPKSKMEYWVPKLRRNVKRDLENVEALERFGWRVLVMWECELKNMGVAIDGIERFLNDCNQRKVEAI